MNLSAEFRKAGIEWCVDYFYVDEAPSIRRGSRLRIRIADMAKAEAAHEEPVVQELLLYPELASEPVNDLLARAMRKLIPTHSVVTAWNEARGMTPVKVPKVVLGARLAECIHTALRKSVDSPESCIQWNAIHHLAPKDWAQFLDLAREEVRELLAEKKVGTRTHVTQYDVGMALKRAFVGRADEVTYRESPKTRLPGTRTDLEKFSLMSFNMANNLTADQDFVLGWASFLCVDIPHPKAVVA